MSVDRVRVRVLILEDRASDAELVVHELRRNGFDPEWRRVDTRQEYLAHLSEAPDLILADYSLPGFDALEALRLMQQRDVDIPFIIVSGSIGEEVAVSAIRGGAADYLLKDRLARLGAAVARAMDDGRQRAQRRKIEEDLRQSQRNLAEAQRIAHLGSWELDVASGAVRWSDESCRIFGMEPGVFGGTEVAFLALVAPDDRDAIREARRASIEEGSALDLAYRIVRPDGHTRVVHENGGLVRDPAGTPIRVVGTVQDISERVAADAERARLISAVEQSGDAIVISQIDGPIEYVNRSFELFYGYQRDEVLGQTLRILKSSRHTDKFWEGIWGRIRAGGTWSGPIVNRRKDGTLVEVAAVVSGFGDAQGQPTGAIATHRDVTRERLLEDQLRQAAKMEAIGQLAGGVAHDFNNMLTAIRGYTELVRQHLPADDAQDRADLEQVVIAADRAAELTRQLLAFSRKQVLAPQVLDPAEIVAGIIPLLRRLLGEHIEIAAHVAPGSGRIRVDPAQLEQVILNLAVNARDAMPDGGKLTIESSSVDLDPRYIAVHPGAVAGPHIRLAVSDTGIGMDAATVEHIFEPFFTTKQPGTGTGMGLATVYGIVQQSGGAIYVYSEPGHGTSFHISFPRVVEVAAEAFPAAPATVVIPVGSETILLVEDEAAVRGFARRTLAGLGYTVLDAANGAAAMALAASDPEPIHLLVTDVIMPGMHGAELARQLAVARPGLRTLFISGFTENSVIHHGVVGANVTYLPKPFSAEALGRVVRTVLDRAV